CVGRGKPAMTAASSERVELKYTYVSAWLVHGGVNLSKDRTPQVLFSSERSRFVLTTNPAIEVETIDFGRAIGILTLNKLFGHAAGDFETGMRKQLDEIRAERQKLAGQTALVAYGYGRAFVSLAESRERPDYIVFLDGVDTAAIKESHRDEIESMKVA